MWGVLPIYWMLLQRFGSEVVVCQRVLWTVVWLLPLLLWTQEWRVVRDALCNPRLLRTHAWTALLLTINWSLFIWANQHGHIVEASLGYFLNPLLNVAIGCVLHGERLSRWRAVSIALATAGVILQVVLVGKVPWIALSLAISFALYGLFRKRSPLGSLPGLAVESTLTLPFALGALLWLSAHGTPVMGTGTAGEWMLLFSAGACTAAPLLTFAYAARHLRFSTLGLLQFISPTGQFCVGAFVYHEQVSMGTLLSFVFIWIGVAVFCVETYLSQRRPAPSLQAAITD
ncbi:MAG: EamA family transporter RarD [Verrucomicrobiota bacterium]|jgi:chloramphenicol-sensitive protein RarD